MKNFRVKASYTIESAVYIPIIIFLFFQTIDIGIDYWQTSKEREVKSVLLELDIVQEFYGYQILEEVGKELEDDKS